MQTEPRPVRALSETTVCRRVPLYNLAHILDSDHTSTRCEVGCGRRLDHHVEVVPPVFTLTRSDCSRLNGAVRHRPNRGAYPSPRAARSTCTYPLWQPQTSPPSTPQARPEQVQERTSRRCRRQRDPVALLIRSRSRAILSESCSRVFLLGSSSWAFLVGLRSLPFLLGSCSRVFLFGSCSRCPVRDWQPSPETVWLWRQVNVERILCIIE